MSYVLGWLFFCVVAGMFAHIRRHRNGAGWFFIGLFFSPLVAFILLLILDKKETVEVAPPRVDPRWQNLRAGVELETAVQAEAMAAVTARRQQQDRQAIIGSVVVVALIIGAIVVAAVSATSAPTTTSMAQAVVQPKPPVDEPKPTDEKPALTLAPAVSTSTEDEKTLAGLSDLAAYTIACKPDIRPEVYENMSAMIKELPFSVAERRAAVEAALARVKSIGVGQYCSYAALKSQKALRALGQ